MGPNWNTGYAVWALENTLCCESGWAPEQGIQGAGGVFSLEDLQSGLSVVPGKQLPYLNRVAGSDTSTFLGFQVKLIPLCCLAVKQNSQSTLIILEAILLEVPLDYLFNLHWFISFYQTELLIFQFLFPRKKSPPGSYSLPVLSIAHHDSDSHTLSFLTLHYFQKILTEVLLFKLHLQLGSSCPW